MSDPILSIVIVSYNVGAALADCLQSVLDNHPPVSWQIVVVDNASSDGSVDLIRSRFPECHLIANEDNRGFAAASNQGIIATGSRYVLLLNPDTVVTVGALDALYRAMENRSALGILGPTIVNPDGSFQSGPLAFPRWTLANPGTSREVKSGPVEGGLTFLPADWVLGACMMVRRGMLSDIGLMDEGYFLYGEEKDWCLRAGRAGWLVEVLTDARVIHYGGLSTGQSAPRSYEIFVDSQVRFYCKFCPWYARSLFLVGTCVQNGAKSLFAWTASLSSRGGGKWRQRARTYAAGGHRAWEYLVGSRRVTLGR